ncbi:hypothetical protein [Minwuia sp. IMCC3060]|uniref:hypothetical protein n=1 Tax=Minwuia sp. IMCC3060 TaxID=3040675 RepID=UPI00247A588E|nr:hypothetical protein [Minwuia sp. IMCC3060]
MTEKPDFLIQGEPARLFPIVADTSRENRIASIFLSLLPQIPSLAQAVLDTAGLRVGKRTRIETFTEVVLVKGPKPQSRPDGLLIVSTGKTSWSALIEAKVGKAKLDQEQVQRYVDMAKANGIDAVITISNEFVARADHSPVTIPSKLLRKTSLFHWSWTWIATQCEILAVQDVVERQEQAALLNEFLRFLNHPGTGVERFSQMGPNWKDLVQAVTNNGTLNKSAPEVEEGVGCWFEEGRDLSLQLSRHVGQSVESVIERKLRDDPAARLRAGVAEFVEDHCLNSTYRIPDSAADIEVRADLTRKTVSAAMKIKAPLDRKSTTARVNWLIRMLKHDDPRIIVRAHWPGKTPATQRPISVLRESPNALQTENKNATPHSFEILLIESLGKRFAGRRTFIEDVERIVPDFYDLVGQNLRAWQAAPPKPVKSRTNTDEDDLKTESVEQLE